VSGVDDAAGGVVGAASLDGCWAFALAIARTQTEALNANMNRDGERVIEGLLLVRTFFDCRRASW